MNEKNILSKVDVFFSSDLLIVKFLSGCFNGRKLAIKGQALSCGFDAYPSTMKWAKPFENEIINDEQKKHILESINERTNNSCAGFKVIWEE